MESQNEFGDWVLLFALLLATTLLLLTQNQPAVRAVRAQALEFTARIESSFAWMGRYVRVLEENDELRRENIELSSQVARTRAVRERNDELERLLNLADTTSAPVRAARIVTKDIFGQDNFLTLDVGREDGVREGMPVVHGEGIVGTVVLTSDRYSQVMPFINTDFRVPGVVLPIRAEGIVRWDGEYLNRLQLDHVVKTESVETGQQVVTSGHSGIFPAGRAIGTVDSVAAPPGRNELRIFLRPAVPVQQISHAVVLLRLADRERRALEKQPVR